MLAPDHDHAPSGGSVEDAVAGVLQLGHGAGRVAARELQRWEGVHAIERRVATEFVIVELDIAGCVDDRAGAQPGA